MEMCLYIQLFHSLKRSTMEVGAVLKRETGVQVNKMLIMPNCRLTCLHYVNFLPQKRNELYASTYNFVKP